MDFITRSKREILGLCIYCGKDPPSDGKKGCAPCRAKATAAGHALRAKRSARGACVYCDTHIDRRVQRDEERSCTSCREAMRIKRKDGPVYPTSRPGYWDLVKANRCVKCMTQLPDGRKAKMCEPCAKSRAAYESARYHCLADRGLCGRCGGVNDTHRRVCKRCVRP
jgi:hypothetical protein